MSKHVPKHSCHPFAALRLPAGAVLLAATTACVSATGPDGELGDEIDPSLTDELGNVDLSPVTPASDQWNACPTWDCGKNHAMLNTFPVPELRENGQPNDQGLRIFEFKRPNQNTNLALTVENGVMTAHSATWSYTGYELIGSQMKVTNGEVVWTIRIANYTYSLPYWDNTGVISAYHLQYYQQGEQNSDGSIPWKNLCNAPLEPADDPLFLDVFETYAILIDDERYDTEAKEVLAGNAEGWFNIACAGSALSKMMLLHFNPHIPAGQWDHTTADERTATLKMLTADYVGLGKAFTRGGQPLLWHDAKSWNDLAGSGTLEAVWDENGAVCLDEPRLADEEVIIDDEPHVLTEQAVLTEIANTCAGNPPTCEVPPTCAEMGITTANWTLHGLWRTLNPQ